MQGAALEYPAGRDPLVCKGSCKMFVLLFINEQGAQVGAKMRTHTCRFDAPVTKEKLRFRLFTRPVAFIVDSEF